jgi:hypothetical protein
MPQGDSGRHQNYLFASPLIGPTTGSILSKESEPAVQRIEHQGFLLLLVAVTLAFAWVLLPFYGAVLWR